MFGAWCFESSKKLCFRYVDSVPKPNPPKARTKDRTLSFVYASSTFRKANYLAMLLYNVMRLVNSFRHIYIKYCAFYKFMTVVWCTSTRRHLCLFRGCGVPLGLLPQQAKTPVRQGRRWLLCQGSTRRVKGGESNGTCRQRWRTARPREGAPELRLLTATPPMLRGQGGPGVPLVLPAPARRTLPKPSPLTPAVPSRQRPPALHGPAPANVALDHDRPNLTPLPPTIPHSFPTYLSSSPSL
jgi:hypothetical protein